MDNLTHTVIGLVAGETIARVTRSPRRASLLAIGMIGGNLPDSDLLVSYGEGKLGYLLQHRGYTHTIVGCVVLALLLYAAVALVLRARGAPLSRREHASTAAFALFAVQLHLGMDALNNYGVHPFWPFDDRWFYGDVLFIVEPSFWIAAAPLVFLQRTVGARVVLAVVLLVALVLNAFMHAGQGLQWAAVTLVAAALVLLGRRASPRVAVAVATAGCVAVVSLFFVSSVLASRAVRASAAARFAGETAIDEVMTPAPMQPACWDVISMRRSSDRYFARQATATPWSGSSPRCVRVTSQQGGGVTAPWVVLASDREPDPRVRWVGVVEVPVTAFELTLRGHCRLQAMMQFVRAPYVGEHEGQAYLGDLRFDREAALGFAELPVSEPGEGCPRPVPWKMPRADLLSPP